MINLVKLKLFCTNGRVIIWQIILRVISWFVNWCKKYSKKKEYCYYNLAFLGSTLRAVSNPLISNDALWRIILDKNKKTKFWQTKKEKNQSLLGIKFKYSAWFMVFELRFTFQVGKNDHSIHPFNRCPPTPLLQCCGHAKIPQTLQPG